VTPSTAIAISGIASISALAVAPGDGRRPRYVQASRAVAKSSQPMANRSRPIFLDKIDIGSALFGSQRERRICSPLAWRREMST
jgi:hypothetical protein